MPEQHTPKGLYQLFLPGLYFSIFLTNTKSKATSAEQENQTWSTVINVCSAGSVVYTLPRS